MIKNLISICIPTYEMHGLGSEFLDFSINKILSQTYTNYEIVISDQSIDQSIFDCYLKHKDSIDITYIKSESDRGNSSSNINNAINNTKGEYIKVLFQDDFLYHDDSLQDIINSYENNPDKSWLVTACEHTFDGITFNKPFYPIYNPQIHLDMNTISSPSVLSFKKDCTLLFDENLKWLMDVDLYKRLYDSYGDPIIINEINVVNRLWDKQYNKTIPDSIKSLELDYVKNKRY